VPRNKFDQIVDMTVQRMMALIDETPETDQPFDSKKLNRREQLMQYLPTRTDPVAARAVVDGEGVKGAIEYAETMEKYLKEVLANVATTGNFSGAGNDSGGLPAV
jgi:hypothetical protein